MFVGTRLQKTVVKPTVEILFGNNIWLLKDSECVGLIKNKFFEDLEKLFATNNSTLLKAIWTKFKKIDFIFFITTNNFKTFEVNASKRKAMFINNTPIKWEVMRNSFFKFLIFFLVICFFNNNWMHVFKKILDKSWQTHLTQLIFKKKDFLW